MQKQTIALMALVMMATAAFAMPRSFGEFRQLDGDMQSGSPTATEPAPEPVLAKRPALWEVRKRPTLYEVRKGTTSLIDVGGEWDHDNNPFTPTLWIHGTFDEETGECLSWRLL